MKRSLRTDARFAAFIIALWSVAMIVICLTSCKTIKVDGGSHSKDSVRIEHRVDTFYLEFVDSIRIQMPCSDTIQVAYVDRVRYKTQKEIHYKHDTVLVSTIDTLYQPVEVVKEVTKKGFLYNSGIALWVILGLLLAGIIIGIILKIKK